MLITLGKHVTLGKYVTSGWATYLPFNTSVNKMVIHNKYTNEIDSIDYSEGTDLYFTDEGEYDIYFLFNGTSNKVINSNKETFYVKNRNIELDNIFQNIHFLKALSNNQYIDIKNFDSTYLELFDIDSYVEDYKTIFSALDIFIKDKIYLLVIILFSLEIYFRKRIGLL